jgi:lipid-binding SYLF domain-containing protein
MGKEETEVKKKDPLQTEGRWARWGRTGFDKSIKISDWFSPYANAVSSAVGGERFWPQSNDFPLELEKCERILRAFTEEGVQQKDSKEEQVQDQQGNWIKKKVRVLRKIPPAAIRNAKGIAIYSSMRSGIAPLGGGGGSGVFMARLPNGAWSAPSAISPQNAAVGLLLGIDFLDVILLINSEKTMETFKSHRIDLGAETGIAAGPYGTGYSAEASYDKAPVYSYVRNRGAYAGVELLGQVFLHRFDENERFYYWPGITAADILTNKVRVPPVVLPLHRALRDAETGRAQGGKLERTEFDIVKVPESEVFKHLGPNALSRVKRSPRDTPTPTVQSTTANGTPLAGSSTAQSPDQESLQELDLEEAAKSAEKQLANGGSLADHSELEQEGEEEEIVRDGERLRLPPTPAELEMMEAAGIPDDEDLRIEREERARIYALPAPPTHPDVVKHWSTRPSMRAKRPSNRLVMDGPTSPNLRVAQYVPLPPSPSLERKTEERLEFSQDAPTIRLPQQGLAELMNDSVVNAETEEGELIATNLTEEEADKVMNTAVHGGDVDKVAEEVQQEVNEREDDELAHKHRNDTVLNGAEAHPPNEETFDAVGLSDPEAEQNSVDGIGDEETSHHSGAEDTSRSIATALSMDHSVLSSSNDHFDSPEIEVTHLSIEEPDTPATEHQASSVDSDAEDSEAIERMKGTDPEIDVPEEEVGDEGDEGNEHEQKASAEPEGTQPHTPPKLGKDEFDSGVVTPSGVQTPNTNDSAKPTPTRPPRRKRPPRK